MAAHLGQAARSDSTQRWSTAARAIVLMCGVLTGCESGSFASDVAVTRAVGQGPTMEAVAPSASARPIAVVPLAAGAPALTGTWWSGLGDLVVTGLSLNRDGTYVLGVFNAMPSKAGDEQRETGTYAITANAITFTPRMSSCPAAAASPRTIGFSLERAALTLGAGERAAIFSPAPNAAPPGSDRPRLGCFDALQRFTAAPLASLEQTGG